MATSGKTPVESPTAPIPMSRRSLLKGTASASLLLGGSMAMPAFAQDLRNAQPTAEVKTSAGTLRGVMQSGVNAFFGVPYGEPAVGKLRFAAPAPVKPWSGTRDAVRIGNRSPQDVAAGLGVLPEVFALDRAEPMGEDCLSFNVWTPALGKGNRPVMVWLHGGGFTSGSGGWLLYDGARLARNQDVVVVSVNHRLNIFGHLYLAGLGGDEYADSGNAGLLDIVAVLEWVRENIAGFGGNADNVTVFGQSGGAGKVCNLLALESAKGLFHRAIAMSGAALTAIKPEQATAQAERLMNQLGLQKNQVSRLRELSMEQLLVAYAAIPGMGLGPVLDGKNHKRDPFTPDAPAISKDIPLMLGSTEHEVNFFRTTPVDPIDDATLQNLLMQATRRDAAGVSALVATYKSEFGVRPNAEMNQIIASDNFRRGVIATGALKSAQGGAPVYMYYFNWKSTARDGKLGAYHCLDIPFAFDNVDVGAAMTGAGQDRYELAARMSTAFANFARSGNPNHAGLPAWPVYDDKVRATMFFNASPAVVNDPFPASRKALYG